MRERESLIKKHKGKIIMIKKMSLQSRLLWVKMLGRTCERENVEKQTSMKISKEKLRTQNTIQATNENY